MRGTFEDGRTHGPAAGGNACMPTKDALCQRGPMPWRKIQARQCSPTEAIFDRIQMFAMRMGQVSIEHMDYRRLLKTYDHPGNLFFLDPPYLGADLANYRGWTGIKAIVLRMYFVQLRYCSPKSQKSPWLGY